MNYVITYDKMKFFLVSRPLLLLNNFLKHDNLCPVIAKQRGKPRNTPETGINWLSRHKIFSNFPFLEIFFTARILTAWKGKQFKIALISKIKRDIVL